MVGWLKRLATRRRSASAPLPSFPGRPRSAAPRSPSSCSGRRPSSWCSRTRCEGDDHQGARAGDRHAAPQHRPARRRLLLHGNAGWDEHSDFMTRSSRSRLRNRTASRSVGGQRRQLPCAYDDLHLAPAERQTDKLTDVPPGRATPADCRGWPGFWGGQRAAPPTRWLRLPRPPPPSLQDARWRRHSCLAAGRRRC